MNPSSRAPRSLEFIAEPAVLLERSGSVVAMNGAMRRLLGSDRGEVDLFDFVESSHEDFSAYLRRSSASTSPIVGAATLKAREGVSRFRLNCARRSGEAQDCVLVLRCLATRNSQFSILQRQVDDLNAQLHVRQREKSILEEALRDNHDLLRELQHRVKNNIQLMQSLIRMSAKGRQTDEVQELVSAAEFRLQAMASAQEAMNRSVQAWTAPAGILLREVAESVGRAFEAGGNLDLQIADADLPNDIIHAVALIASELVTNAVKHGLTGGRGRILVRLEPLEDGFRLVVHDSGPGIDPGRASQSSGLGLVRALCRQIGGDFEIAYANGARCAVRFGTSPQGVAT